MNDWRPNWKDDSLYPDPEATKRSEWAWEFLRRNKAYQNAYNNLLSTLESKGYFDVSDALKDAKAIKGDGSKEVFEIVQECNKQAFQLSKEFGVRSPLHILPNPEKSYRKSPLYFNNNQNGMETWYPEFYQYKPEQAGTEEPISFLVSGNATEMLKLTREDYESNKSVYVQAELQPRHLLVNISLEKNISDQMEIIKKTAIELQKQLAELDLLKKNRMETKLYSTYLRVLDALDADVNKNEIADVLLPGSPNEYPDYKANKTIYNWISAAEKLCNKGYRSFFNS